VNRTFIFFRSELCSVSPAVSLWWPGEVIDLLNQLPVGSLHYGGMAEGTCVDFIVACSSTLKLEMLPLEVCNLPLRWDRQNDLEGKDGTLEYHERWRNWLLDEIGRLWDDADARRTPPVLIDLDPPFHATQGGKVLCRRLMGEYKVDGPEWVAPDLGQRPEPNAAPDRGHM